MSALTEDASAGEGRMASASPAGEAMSRPPSVGQIAGAFGKIGVLSFGGAAAQIAMMHRMIVDEKRWLTEAQYLTALNFCMLLPGPEAQQLATYVGWKLRGWGGGLVAGLLFIIPGALVLLGLSLLYVLGRDIAVVEGIFTGIKAAVLALVAQALIRIASKAVTGQAARIVAGLSFLALFLVDMPFPLVIITAGVVGYFMAKPMERPEAGVSGAGWREGIVTGAIWGAVWWAPVLAAFLLLGGGSILVEIGLFFSKLAVISFGGAYALLAWLAQEAVTAKAWVTAPEMANGLGLAETTPGPTILVTQFIGFLAAYRNPEGLDPIVMGVLGAAMTSWVIYAPSFLWIFLGAPHVERLKANWRLGSALKWITAAVVGTIAYLALWFALTILFPGGTRLTPLESLLAGLPPPDFVMMGLAVLAFLLVFATRLGLASTVGLMAGAGVIARLIVV